MICLKKLFSLYIFDAIKEVTGTIIITTLIPINAFVISTAKKSELTTLLKVFVPCNIKIIMLTSYDPINANTNVLTIVPIISLPILIPLLNNFLLDTSLFSD